MLRTRRVPVVSAGGFQDYKPLGDTISTGPSFPPSLPLPLSLSASFTPPCSYFLLSFSFLFLLLSFLFLLFSSLSLSSLARASSPSLFFARSFPCESLGRPVSVWAVLQTPTKYPFS